ncbi:MAG: Myo-inositol oxygenase [Bacteroidetes bacterium]|nr:Myo-inositol oxygenase [Bacteroidota bacterium]
MATTDTAPQFRDYAKADTISLAVRDHYRKMRERQTVDYVQRMKKKYLTFDKPMHVWEAMERLNALIDVSDPDLDLPNVQHLIQAAEGAREAGEPDWLQLVALIHDMGKVMYLWGSDEDGTSQAEQWGLVGDIFVVGAKLPDSCVYPQFNELNPDMQDPRYNTPTGMYEPHCGLDRLELAWGHDEYLYQVLKNHKGNTIPEQGMVSVRYHSFYPWHTGNSYEELLCEKDKQYKEWIKSFNRFDLYTKRPESFDLESLKRYYQPIIEKYLGTEPLYW